jgi:hypothetical protein
VKVSSYGIEAVIHTNNKRQKTFDIPLSHEVLQPQKENQNITSYNMNGSDESKYALWTIIVIEHEIYT